MTPHRLTPLVLAAGASSRMGRSKALLDFGGRPLVARVMDVCAHAGLGVPVVVVPPRAPALRAAIAAAGPAVLVENPFADAGQSSSLRVGVGALPADAQGFLLFPVDHPLVRVAEIRRLLARAERRSPGETIIIPSFARRRGHPVIVAAELATELIALPPGASARAVLDADPQRIAYVEMEDDRVLVDMDTPEDYERCLRRFAGS